MADFQALSDDLVSEGIRVFAGSTDPVEKTCETVEKLGITFPVAYGLDAGELSEKTGAFYDEEKKFIHATGFLVGPGNKTLISVYSTGSIGRLTALDVLNLVRFFKSDRKKNFYLADGKLDVR
ncbi:peroxiredoxin [Desulfonema ishimotonii]|uniref:Peroxiredoxin n=1 Tax=Desulfonema ishimotonii TaxID=45657 RepID=A0A401FWD2_9BACT|nr:peroxiredoxin [Desulfonema ishimotonii]